MKLNEQLDQVIGKLRSEHRQQQRPPLDFERMRPALCVNSGHAKQRRGVIGLALTAACIALLLIYFHPFRKIDAPETRAASIAAFLPLPSDAVLPDSPNTTYVRVRLRKGDLRQFGLDIPEIDEKQIVQAEFALGDDGLARAVRLVGPFDGGENRSRAVISR